MSAKDFLDLLGSIKPLGHHGVEDMADKLSFLASVCILSACILITTAKTYLLKPIACYVSTEVGGSNLMDYVENYCWVQGTIPISYVGNMPSTEEEWNKMEEQKILYYQWVPFILALQAGLFYLPRQIWKAICYNGIGVDLEHIIDKSVEGKSLTDGGLQDCATHIAVSIENMLFQQRKSAAAGSKRRFTRLSHNGYEIVTAYAFIKILYALNAIGQIFVMQDFLGFKNQKSAFGFHVLDNMYNGHDWQMTQIFPRVGYCFVKMKVLGVNHNGVTAQCALPNNMINEKIYVFLWWWVTIVAIVSLISLITWLVRFFTVSRQASYIIKYINLGGSGALYNDRDLRDFATKYLCRDGMFLLRMVRLNAGALVTTKVINVLLNRYMEPKPDTTDKVHNPLLPAVGWAPDLEKPPMNGTEDATLPKRGGGGTELVKEISFSPSHPPSDDPTKIIASV